MFLNRSVSYKFQSTLPKQGETARGCYFIPLFATYCALFPFLLQVIAYTSLKDHKNARIKSLSV